MSWIRWGLFLLTFGGTIVIAIGAGWEGIKLLNTKDAAGQRRPLPICLGLFLLLISVVCAVSVLNFFY